MITLKPYFFMLLFLVFIGFISLAEASLWGENVPSREECFIDYKIASELLLMQRIL